MFRPRQCIGNPNTIENFSQSWQRAVQFRDPTPQLERPIGIPGSPNLKEGWAEFGDEWPPLRKLSFASNRSGYGTIKHGEQRIAFAQEAGYGGVNGHGKAEGELYPDKESPSVKDEEGEVGLLGKSTVPMTIFNCTNMLIGAGILALPLGLQQCGWVMGVMLLTLPAVVTAYTATLLVRCLKTDTSAVTYGDIAYLAFGTTGRHFVEVLFAFELIAANVALTVLFADSVSTLAPVFSPLTWKVIFAISLIPLNFAPLRILSISSAIGIFCFFGILTILTTSGLTKPDAPGSLLQVAETRLYPLDWTAVPASFGLFMAPWGGHSIVPAVYKDMRHPQKYNNALKYIYSITYGLALLIGVLGYLMFGDHVFTEITSNILDIKEYPAAILLMMLVLVSIVPLTKMALTNRPVMDTINRKLGIDTGHRDSLNLEKDRGERAHRLGRVAVGTLCNMLELALAILIPNFDDVVALMGSGLCITICIILPGSFYLKICRDKREELSISERFACWSLILGGTVFAVAGSFFALFQAS